MEYGPLWYHNKYHKYFKNISKIQLFKDLIGGYLRLDSYNIVPKMISVTLPRLSNWPNDCNWVKKFSFVMIKATTLFPRDGSSLLTLSDDLSNFFSLHKNFFTLLQEWTRCAHVKTMKPIKQWQIVAICLAYYCTLWPIVYGQNDQGKKPFLKPIEKKKFRGRMR